MTSRTLWSRLSLLFVIALLAGCGGGGAGTPSGVSAVPQSASDGGARTYSLSGAAASFDVPPVGGFTGVLAFPAASVPPGTSLTLTTSLQAPGGTTVLEDLQRNMPAPQATQATGRLDVYFYMTIVATATVTFPTVPGFTVTLPTTIDPSGRQFSYAIQQNASNGAELSFRTEGPATVSGRNVTFTPSSTPLTLQAGQSYIVAFYSTGQPPASTQHMYILNFYRTIRIFPANANGNLFPVRTIDPDDSKSPSSMAVDANGFVYVLNNGHYNSKVQPIGDASIDVYAPRANGAVAPIRTIIGKATGLGTSPVGQSIAVDGRGNVAVLTSRSYSDPRSPLDIKIYDAQASGNVAPLRTITSLRDTTGDFTALSSDGRGDLAVLLLQAEAPYNNSINIYGPSANGTSAPDRSIGPKYLTGAVGIAFSSTGEIAADDFGISTIQVFARGQTGNAPPTRTIASPPFTGVIMSAIAFDDLGNLALIAADYDPNIFTEVLTYGPRDTDISKPSYTLRGGNTGLDFYSTSIAFGP